MWNLRAVSAKALIVRFFCSFRAKFVDVPFPRTLPWAICFLALQAASKPLYVRTSLDCVQTKAFLTILKSFIGQQSFFFVPLLLEYKFHGLRVEWLHGG